ncbi:MAG TPA: DUF4349 domain-containing protein [Actinomycetota bacterium]|nr:DUF4349 domain-containing protein [Actinomycetota bacterium]
METAFEYLNRVHDDLMDAAARERARLRAVRSASPRRRVPWGGLAAAGVAVLLVAGAIGSGILSGSDDEAGQEVAGSTGATGATGGAERLRDLSEEPAPAPGVVPGDQGAAGDDVPPPRVDRVIRTAELSLVIPRDSFDERFGRAVDAAEANGGFVADSSSRERAGNLTLRVPAENFDETLRALRGLGTVRVESLHGKDVTADYVDLRARLRIARSRRAVLLGLMEEARTIEQTIRVQNALDVTQLRIEELQGSLRLLDDRTSLATIALDLREQGVEEEAEVDTPSIPNAFERAIAGAVGVVAAIVIGLGYLLPLLVLGLTVWFVVTRIRRRRSEV